MFLKLMHAATDRTAPQPRRMLLALLGGLVVAGGASASADAPGLRVAFSRALAPPFVIWRDNQPSAGLDVEIVRAMAAQLKAPLVPLVLPRLRVEAALAEGEADMACNLSPITDARRDPLPMGPALFELQDVLLAHQSAAGADKLEQLPAGAAVGALQGQSYGNVAPLFTSGRLKRDDALDEERLMRKLVLNRHPYGISTRQTAGWFAAQDGSDGLASWRLPLGQRAYRCTFSPRGRFEARQLSAALEQLQAAGRIEQIVAAYTSPPVAVVVSTSSPLRDVSRTALAELFLGQRSRLNDGSAPEPVMAVGPERQQFLSAVLKRDASQYRAAWAAQQFGGRLRPPLELRDAESIKNHLLRNANAIGYLPLSLVDASLRVIYLP